MKEIEGIAFNKTVDGKFHCILGFTEESTAKVAYDTMQIMGDIRLELMEHNNLVLIKAHNDIMGMVSKMPLIACSGYYDFKDDVGTDDFYISTVSASPTSLMSVLQKQPTFYIPDISPLLLCGGVDFSSPEN